MLPKNSGVCFPLDQLGCVILRGGFFSPGQDTVVYGPAGTETSAIAQILSEEFEKQKHLTTNSFFSRVRDRQRMAKYFITTIAYQILQAILQIGEAIGPVIAKDLSILYQSPNIQLQEIIVELFIYLTTHNVL
jgi:hypothetical protein